MKSLTEVFGKMESCELFFYAGKSVNGVLLVLFVILQSYWGKKEEEERFISIYYFLFTELMGFGTYTSVFGKAYQVIIT